MDPIIPFGSNRPNSQKVSYFSSIFHRLGRIPLIQDNFLHYQWYSIKKRFELN